MNDDVKWSEIYENGYHEGYKIGRRLGSNQGFIAGALSCLSGMLIGHFIRWYFG